jgi:hypothetical protein
MIQVVKYSYILNIDIDSYKHFLEKVVLSILLSFEISHVHIFIP